jgi:hypothetical protein
MLSSHVLRLCVAIVSGLGIGVTAAGAQPPTEPPQVPANLSVPADHYLYLVAHAIGTQNYMCLPTDKNVAWRFLAPQATLFVPAQANVGQQVATHFLSANPLEDGLARPTWQHSVDTSRVWGRAAASSVDPNYVAPGAIPWLLVQVTGASLGPTGGSLLTATTYIHRVHTAGGVAPSTGCAKSRDVGALAMVPYETDYYFYRANQ